MGLESIMNQLDSAKRRNIEGQMGFFDSLEPDGQPKEEPLEKAEDFSQMDKLSQEKEVTGMYLSGHPMSAYSMLYSGGRYARSIDILQSAQGEGTYADGQRVSMLAIVTSVRRKDTRSGSTMAFVTLEDMSGAVNGLVFPSVLDQYGNLLYEGAVIEAQGRLSFQEDKEPELLMDKAALPPKAGDKAGQKPSGRPGLYLRVDSQEDPRFKKAMQYVEIFDGGHNDLYILFKDTGKLVRAPAKYRVEMSRQLLGALERLLGSENAQYVRAV